MLMFGKSKRKMKPIMIDAYHKCENYMNARGNCVGWHKIELAPDGATVWRQKTCSVVGSGSKTNRGPLRVGHGPSGYIGKNGFNSNT